MNESPNDKLDKSMSKGLKFLSSTAGSVISAAGTLVNGYYERKMTRELAAERGRHEKAMLATNHGYNMELLDKTKESYIELLDRQKEHDMERDYIVAHFQTQNVRGTKPYRPGEWRKEVCPNSPEPFVIFISQLRQNHNTQDNFFGYNPIIGLCRRFNEQIGAAATVIETNEALYGEDEVRRFINNEFPESSVAVVYADYLGNEFNIRTTFNGMSKDQFIVYEGGQVEVISRQPKTVFLGHLPKPAGERDHNNPEARDYEELAYDLIANVWLQILLDTRYIFFPETLYTPKAHTVLKKKLERLREIGLEKELNNLEKIAAQSDENVNQERKELELLRLSNF